MIKHNGKKCSIDGCDGLLFSYGLCVSHSRDKASKPAIRKKIEYKIKPIPFNDYGFNTQLELFEHKWNKAKNKEGHVYCELTGIILNRFEGTYLFMNLFSHILSKGLYKKLKLHPDNIIIVHPDIHYSFDFESKEMQLKKFPIAKWDYLEQRKQELLKLYKTL